MVIDVSLCVATYRRPDGLAALLRSLARMKCPDGVRFDVWVVDNDPEGGACEAARAAGADAGLDVHWVHEPRRNIAHARNAAIERARGHWLGFVDDDEVVHEGWLAAYWEGVYAWGCDGAFGPVLPRLAPEGCAWLDASFYHRPRHPSGTRVPAAEMRCGNAFVRASLLRRLRFDPSLGRSGGEDAELFGRVRAGGADLRWCDDAVVEETVPAARRRPGWLMQRAFRGGCVSARLERRVAPACRSTLRALRALVGLAGFAAATCVACVRGRREATRWLLRACVQAGRLYGFGGGAYEEYRG